MSMSAREPAGSGLSSRGQGALGRREPADLADILERVLDKGIVIAGDVAINLLDIELLTIKLRLLVASADKAREMGIDWWESDPFLSSSARAALGSGSGNGDGVGRDGRELHERLERLEDILESLRQRQLSEGRPGDGGERG
jgi:Gas vesicle protein